MRFSICHIQQAFGRKNCISVARLSRKWRFMIWLSDRIQANLSSVCTPCGFACLGLFFQRATIATHRCIGSDLYKHRVVKSMYI